MTSVNRISNMPKLSKLVNSKFSTSNSSLYLALRSMSSSSSKLFVGAKTAPTAKIVMDRAFGRSRGFGIVTFTSSEEASNTITALDGNYGFGGNNYGSGSEDNYPSVKNNTDMSTNSCDETQDNGNYGFGGNNYGSGSEDNYHSGENNTDMSTNSYDETQDMELFEAWMVKYGKSYNDLGEKNKRFKIFKASRKYIDEQNAIPNRLYTLGLNKFADRTVDEVYMCCIPESGMSCIPKSGNSLP